MDLTEKQKIFCREYIFDWNGTRAYKVAYPNTKSDNTAAVEANKFLRKPNIQEYIEKIQKDLEKLSGISRLKVINEFRKIGFSSIANLHNTWIERKDFEQLTDEQRESIQEIETKVVKQLNKLESGPGCPVFDDVEYVKIRLFDKNKALENINKMLGYNEPEKLDLTGSGLESKLQITVNGIDIDLSK